MTNPNQTNLFPFNEIVGAMGVDQLSDEQIKTFKHDPQASLYSLGFEIGCEINVVENTSGEINLALPFYAGVDQMQAELLKDENLSDVSAGEILISILAVGGMMLGVGLAGTIGVSVTTAGVVGGIVGGIAGAVVVSGIIAGGIAGADQGIKEKGDNNK